MKYQKRMKRWVGSRNPDSETGHGFEYFPEYGKAYTMGNWCFMRKFGDKYVVNVKSKGWSSDADRYRVKFLRWFKSTILKTDYYQKCDLIIDVNIDKSLDEVYSLTEILIQQAKDKNSRILDKIDNYYTEKPNQRRGYDDKVYLIKNIFFKKQELNEYVKSTGIDYSIEMGRFSEYDGSGVIEIKVPTEVYILKDKIVEKHEYLLGTTLIGQII